MKNILITGGLGFIGSNLARKLIEKNYNVTVLDNLSPQIHGDKPKGNSLLSLSIESNINFIKGSVTCRHDWKIALKDQDAVIHLAAETGTGQSMYKIQRYVDVNIGGTAILMDILANSNHSVKKVIVASSRAVYGEGRYRCIQHGIVYPTERLDSEMSKGDFSCKCPICHKEVLLLPTTENSMLHPASVYGITKQNQEQMVLRVGKNIGISVIAFRYQNVYGPEQSLLNPYTGILSIFSARIKNGKEINIFEDGKETRDFVFIDDVVDATILGLEKDQIGCQAYNVGTGKSVDVLTLAQTLCKNYGVDIPLRVSGNYRLGDIRHGYTNISKIQHELGFDPKWSFSKGIASFTQWVNKQEIQADKYEKSLLEMKKKRLYK